MTIAQIKKRMLEHRDFFGGDILNLDEIEGAKTKKELRLILDRHSDHMKMMEIDAQRHHDQFLNKLGLRFL